MYAIVRVLNDNDRGLTRCGARRTRYTPAIWLISGNVRLNECTGGARCGSGTLAEYSNGSVSSTYCTRHASDVMTGVKTAPESKRPIAADNYCCLAMVTTPGRPRGCPRQFLDRQAQT